MASRQCSSIGDESILHLLEEIDAGAEVAPALDVDERRVRERLRLRDRLEGLRRRAALVAIAVCPLVRRERRSDREDR